MRRKRVYMSHPLGAPTWEARQANRRNACQLVGDLVVQAEHAGEPITPFCAWIHLAEVWTEAQGQEIGLVVDCDQINVCDELWMLGPAREPSPGMKVEIAHARLMNIPIVDKRSPL